MLCIQGLQFEAEAQTDEELDKIETICTGEYYDRNGARYILYEEAAEGLEEPLKNMIKLKGGEFTLTKKGAVNVQMVFTEGKKTITEYATPFGSILIGLDTSRVELLEENEDRFLIQIDYALEANYQFIADCHIRITVSSNKKGTEPAC